MIKNIIYCIIIALVIVIGYQVYHNQTTDYEQNANIETIRQMVKLNTLELTDEVVFCDTIDNIGVVYATEIRILIGFDIENLKWNKDNDSIIVTIPDATVDIYQTGKEQYLDSYHINPIKDIILSPTITSTQSIEIHRRIAKHIEAEVIRRDYAGKARKTALLNLQKLFSTMGIKIIDKENSTNTTPTDDSCNTTERDTFNQQQLF